MRTFGDALVITEGALAGSAGSVADGRGLRPAGYEPLELPAQHAAAERSPFGPGEPQDGPARIPAVADADTAAG